MECFNEKKKFDPLMFLSLPVVYQKKKLKSIKKCLKYNFKEEILDGVECEKCLKK